MRINRKLVAISLYSDEMASARYRIYQYLPFLQNRCYFTKTFYRFKNDKQQEKFSKFKSLWFLIKIIMALPKFDYVLIHKYYCKFRFVNRFIRRLSKRLIFDFDDAIYVTSDGSAISPYVSSLNYLIRVADAVTVVSDQLKNFAVHTNSNTIVIPTVVDVKRYELCAKDKSKDNSNSLKIGWIGSSGGDFYLGSITDVFDVLYDKYGKNVELVIVTGYPIKFKTRMVNKQVIWQLSKEFDYFRGIDIGIMPLIENERTKGKGGFKLIQYMASGIPVVASPVGIIIDIIKNGVNGYLAGSSREWISKLSTLIENKNLRYKFSSNAMLTVRQKYDISVGVRLFTETLDALK